MKNIKGFTFVELLVVITIIAVLMAIAAVSYSSTTKKSRDAKRVADMEQIRSALEICRSENGTYPLTNEVTTSITCSGNTVLSRYPIGPKADVYSYTRTGTGFTYTLINTAFEVSTNCSYTVSGTGPYTCTANQP